MTIKRQRILLHPELKNKIEREYKTSRVTVYDALEYNSHSTLAIKIRKKAIALLKKESLKPITLKK